jgi:hypothetical protein
MEKSMFKRILLPVAAVITLVISALPLSGVSQEGEQYIAGEHYDVISPAIRTSSPGKI